MEKKSPIDQMLCILMHVVYFKLNDEGFIYEHKIERILRNDMLERGYVNPLLANLMRRYGTAYPVPVAGFKERRVMGD